MIKVPATPAGIPAIRALIGEGINVNVTLLFALEAYEAVAEAYITGLEAFAAKGGDLGRVASVASFFVSRIDSAVDALDRRAAEDAEHARSSAAAQGGSGGWPSPTPSWPTSATRRSTASRAGARWPRGARRPSDCCGRAPAPRTPHYRDVIYVEELIGPDTVDTIPPATSTRSAITAGQRQPRGRSRRRWSTTRIRWPRGHQMKAVTIKLLAEA